jgi:DNA-binding XRE family transcriptional regulator
MIRKKLPPIRNKLDLADPRQARLVRKRLKLSEDELAKVVEKAGNSIAAISKQAALQLGKQAAKRRVKQMPEPAEVPVAAAIASSANAEPSSVTELSVANEPAG